MSKIYLKVKKQRIAYAKKDMYCTRAIHYTTIDKYALAQLMQTDTGLPKGVVLAVWAAIEKQFQQMILNGHSINLEGLGVLLRPCRRIGAYPMKRSLRKHTCSL